MISFKGLVGAVFEGVGVAAGSLIGGILMDRYGGTKTFRWFSIGAFICFLIHVGIQKLISQNIRGKMMLTNGNELNKCTYDNNIRDINAGGDNNDDIEIKKYKSDEVVNGEEFKEINLK